MDANPFQVLQDSYPGRTTLHVFRDREQFNEWMLERSPFFDPLNFEFMKIFADDDSEWMEYNRPVTVNHTQE
jgi:hypothetical protein